MVRFTGEPRLELTVKIKGNVKKEWTWEPERVIFSDLKQNSRVRQSLTLLQDHDAPPVEPGDLSLPRRLQAELFTDDKDARRWTLTLQTVPPLRPGRQDLVVYVSCSGQGNLIGPIPVTLLVERETASGQAKTPPNSQLAPEDEPVTANRP